MASSCGHLEIVKLLLSDERVNPSVDDNYSIKFASRNGHLEVVKLLYKKVYLSLYNKNFITDESLEGGYIKIIEFILNNN
jgi:hypothetical protein